MMIESLLDACEVVLNEQGEPAEQLLVGIASHGNETLAWLAIEYSILSHRS
jgi:hypothetical protein